MLKGNNPCPPENGKFALEAVLAVHLSEKEGKEVSFPLKNQEFEVNIT